MRRSGGSTFGDGTATSPRVAARRGAVCLIVLVTLVAILAVSMAALPLDPATAVPSDYQGVDLRGDTKTQVDGLQAQADAVQSEIDALDVDLERLTERYNELSITFDTINEELGALRRELGLADRNRSYRQGLLEDRVVATYKAGGKDQLLEILLGADGFNDFLSRLALVTRLTMEDHRLVDNLETSVDQVDSLVKQIEIKKSQELVVRGQLEAQQRNIELTLAERRATLAGLDTEIGKIIESERQRQEQERLWLQEQLLAGLGGWQHYDGPLPQTDDAILNQFVQTAAFYLGIPYVWAGERPSTGFDCSGFTRYVFAQHGVDLPHYSGYQAAMGVPIPLDQIRPGDLVAFGFPVHHVGLYIGEGKFIHAPRTGDVVRIAGLASRRDLSAIRRFPLEARSGEPRVE